jgi:hypothetical protein
MKVCAVAMSFQGTIANPKNAQSTWPLRIVRYFGNRPVISAPNGIEFAPKLTPNVLRRYEKETRKIPQRAAGVQLWSRMASSGRAAESQHKTKIGDSYVAVMYKPGLLRTGNYPLRSHMFQ